MKEADVDTYKYDSYDVTKVWPHADYPLIKLGKMTLNRNVQNYFNEIEQAAYSPSHLVPGIEPSNDKMLQGRLFSYPDTHRHRLGGNYMQYPINCPYRARVANYQRDGFASVGDNGGAWTHPNYEPNSYAGAPKEAGPSAAWAPQAVSGTTGKFKVQWTNNYFEQPGVLYSKVFTD